MKESSIFKARTFTFFSDSVLCLGRFHQHPNANESWKNRLKWIATDERYRDYDGISGEPTRFQWNIFPGLTTLQLYGKVSDLLHRLRENQKISQEQFYSFRCSTAFLVTRKTIKQKYSENAKVRNCKEIWYRTIVICWSRFREEVVFYGRDQEFGIISRKRCWWNSPKLDDQFSLSQVHCLGVSSKAKGTENCRFSLLLTKKHVRLFSA